MQVFPPAPVRSDAPAASWFLGRSVWRRRWTGLVGLGLLAGIVAGVVLAAVGGIRRTDSAFDRLIDASHLPSVQLMAPTFAELSPAYGTALRALSTVESATPTRLYVGRDRVEKNWSSVTAYDESDPTTPVVVEGRDVSDDAADEVIVSANTARLFDLGVGSRFDVDFYTRARMESIGLDTWTDPAGPRPPLNVVGIYRDPLDAAYSSTATSVRAGAAFDLAHRGDAGIAGYQVRLRPGASERRFLAELDEVNALEFPEVAPAARPRPRPFLESARRAEERSRGVVSLGLGAFAAVAAAAGAVAHGQALRRWSAPMEADQAALSSIGATRRGRTAAIVVAALPHVALAVPVALAIVVVSSGLFPFGVLAAVEPAPGLRFDAALLVVGAVVTVPVLLGISWLVASAVVRGPARSRRVAQPPGFLATAEALGVPVPASVGVRFVLRPGSARRALPVNTSIAAAVLGIAGIAAAAVFTSSLRQLVETPERYGNGWDLNIEVLASDRGAAPLARLVADPDIESVETSVTPDLPIAVGGREVSATVLRTLKGSPHLQVQRGRPPTGPEEAVVGPRLLEELGVELGGTVAVTGAGGAAPVEVTVVGVALSIVGESNAHHSDVYFGADVHPSIVPRSVIDESYVMTMISFADGVDVAAATRRLDERYPYAVMNESVPRPPSEVTNVAQLERLPRVLAGFLAFLGCAALVHALIVTVRSRRHDLGVLRSLGFTRRQSAATILSMTSTIVAMGVTLGVPLGIVVGTSGWRLVAQRLYVPTDGVRPMGFVGAAAIVAFVTANLVALVPARIAARQSPIEALRAE